jgi:hypothetical protein
MKIKLIYIMVLYVCGNNGPDSKDQDLRSTIAELERLDRQRSNIRLNINASLRRLTEPASCYRRARVLSIVGNDFIAAFDMIEEKVREKRGTPDSVDLYRGIDDDVNELNAFLNRLLDDMRNESDMNVAEMFANRLFDFIKDDLDPKNALLIITRMLEETKRQCKTPERRHAELDYLLRKEMRLKKESDCLAFSALESI